MHLVRANVEGRITNVAHLVQPALPTTLNCLFASRRNGEPLLTRDTCNNAYVASGGSLAIDRHARPTPESVRTPPTSALVVAGKGLGLVHKVGQGIEFRPINHIAVSVKHVSVELCVGSSTHPEFRAVKAAGRVQALGVQAGFMIRLRYHECGRRNSEDSDKESGGFHLLCFGVRLGAE